jgi:hypothetical protein
MKMKMKMTINILPRMVPCRELSGGQPPVSTTTTTANDDDPVFGFVHPVVVDNKYSLIFAIFPACRRKREL